MQVVTHTFSETNWRTGEHKKSSENCCGADGTFRIDGRSVTDIGENVGSRGRACTSPRSATEDR